MERFVVFAVCFPPSSSIFKKSLQVSPEDPGAQFLIRTGSVGRNRAEASLERAQNLNPRVDVKVDPENIEKKPESFFTQFDAVSLVEGVRSGRVPQIKALIVCVLGTLEHSHLKFCAFFPQ